MIQRRFCRNFKVEAKCTVLCIFTLPVILFRFQAFHCPFCCENKMATKPARHHKMSPAAAVLPIFRAIIAHCNILYVIFT